MPVPKLQAADLARLGADMLMFAREAAQMQTCAKVPDAFTKSRHHLRSTSWVRL